MKFQFIKTLDQKEIPIVVTVGDFIGNAQSNQVAVSMTIDGGKTIHGLVLNKERGAVCSQYGIPLLDKFTGIIPPADVFAAISLEVVDAEQRYIADMEKLVQDILTGAVKIEVFRYGSSVISALQSGHYKKNMDWQSAISKAMTIWVEQNYPTLKLYDWDVGDLTSDIFWPSDLKVVIGAEIIPHDGATCDHICLIPFLSLVSRLNDKYSKIEAKHRDDEDRILGLIALARSTGKPQILNTYVSNECLDGLDDCSFDHVTVWIGSDGSSFTTHVHGH